MAKVAYWDCPAGIAGDMCLGSLVDAGVPLNYLLENLQKLGIGSEFRLRSEDVRRQGQRGTKVHVDLCHEDSHKDSPEANHGDRHSSHPPARHLTEIEQIIDRAALSPRATQWSLQVFRQLAEAEGAVHGMPPENVHFHEVGATDALVDIVGTCLGLDWLGIDALYCSALPTGGGTVRAAHGLLPVPVPAVLKLWEMRQVPVYANGIDRELVTPTGAAIATTLATSFGAPPPMVLHRVGLGAGSRDLAIPNLLRLWVGESSAIAIEDAAMPTETIAVLETQIDDGNPQAIGYVMEVLLAAGALDVFTQAIGMKKSRPGILLTVICHPDRRADCEAILFRETTTIGIRYRYQERSVLNRAMDVVKTPFGEVRLKIASQGQGSHRQVLNIKPEYEDCARLARESGQPWQVIHQSALDRWYRQQPET